MTLAAGAGVGDVARKNLDAWTELAGQCFQPISPAGCHDHLGAGCVQDSCESLAQACGGTGHHRDAPVQAP